MQSQGAGNTERFGDVASFIDCAWVWQAVRMETLQIPALLRVWQGVSKWLLQNLFIIALKLGPLCCEGDAQGVGRSSPR